MQPMLTGPEMTCVSGLMCSEAADRVWEHSELKYCAFLHRKLGYSDNEKRYRRGSLFDFAALNPSRRVCLEVQTRRAIDEISL
jgi:hypothetical protein